MNSTELKATQDAYQARPFVAWNVSKYFSGAMRFHTFDGAFEYLAAQLARKAGGDDPMNMQRAGIEGPDGFISAELYFMEGGAAGPHFVTFMRDGRLCGRTIPRDQKSGFEAPAVEMTAEHIAPVPAFRMRPANMIHGNTQIEFPNFDQTTLPAIPWEWRDSSWRNDACPSWETPQGLHVFIDYAEAEDREYPETPRYSLHDIQGGRNEPYVSSDDFADVPAFLAIVERLGVAFCAQLVKELGAAVVRKIDLENRESDPDGGTQNYIKEDGTCASHNYCDANQTMCEAFELVMRRELFDGEAGETDSPAQVANMQLVSAAWDYARRVLFARVKV